MSIINPYTAHPMGRVRLVNLSIGVAVEVAPCMRLAMQVLQIGFHLRLSAPATLVELFIEFR